MSIDGTEKRKRGRPRVESQAIHMRFPMDLIAAVDGYRQQQSDKPSRTEAIRRIILAYLSGETFK